MNLAVNNLNDNEVKKILIEKIRGLRNALGIPAKKTIPTKSEKILSQLAQSAYEDPCLVTNPKAMSIDTMKELYEQILE
jgi:alcohol dehydrogenase class IV